ncbi:glycosyltransferase [Halobacillus faecis]
MNKAKSILLVDNTLSGHHKIYLDTLLRIKGTSEGTIITNFPTNKLDVRYYFSRNRYIKNAIKKAYDVNAKMLHFLYVDNLYVNPFYLNIGRNMVVLGTLHHYPQNKLKMNLLKRFAKKIALLIVHSEYIKLKLNENNIMNVVVVNYPSFYDYTKSSSKKELTDLYNIPKKQKIFTVLGETRYDKGLDILLNAFYYIPKEYRGSILLNVVGKEGDINKSYILDKTKEYNINCRYEFGFVDDINFMNNVKLSDYVVLPYRKIFTGNSGPMTEAIATNKKVICPKEGNLGYLAEKYNLGYVFTSENAKSLADALIKAIEGNEKTSYNYDVSVDSFLDSYKNVYYNIK